MLQQPKTVVVAHAFGSVAGRMPRATWAAYEGLIVYPTYDLKATVRAKASDAFGSLTYRLLAAKVDAALQQE